MTYPRPVPAGSHGDGTADEPGLMEPVPGLPSIGTNPGQFEDGRGRSVPVEPHIQPLRPAQAQPATEAPPPDHVQGGRDRHPGDAGDRGGRFR